MRRVSLIVLALVVGLSGCAVRGDVQPAATSKSEFEDAFYKGKEFRIAENPEGYKECNLKNLAGNLKGHLLLIHDDHDDTCVP